ncbi:hypothetical protein D1007_19392 [Hordeum vulgare]|nr:hypothetical protein D1007_19392 [Hordeum vulgare]
MGAGPFLDIKCGYLHNTVVTWFTRLYHSGRRGFVVPRRGFIPLTEESVHQILGIPRGDIDVKYEADYDNEDEIASCLFPDDGSRPKIITVATTIINNNNVDATFKKLWLIYIVSTVLAPTTDTRISKKCYPMLAHIDQASRLDLCKIVMAQLHEHLSKSKYTKGRIGTEQGSGRTHEDIKFIAAKEPGLLKETCGQQFEEKNAGKNSRKINARRLKQMPRSMKCAEYMQEVVEKDITDAQQLGVNVSIKRSVHCGFYMLEYVDKWDGVNVPQIRKEDLPKIRKITANKWLSAPLDNNNKWKWQLDNNSV